MLELNLPSENFDFRSVIDKEVTRFDFCGADVSLRPDWEGEGDASEPVIRFVVSNDCDVVNPELRFSISGEANIDALRRFCEMVLVHAEKDWIMRI